MLIMQLWHVLTYREGEATTQVARTIVEGEAARRKAKTARLRAARLAQEIVNTTPKGKPKRK